MRIIRFSASGELTLSVIGLISGVYLFMTFGNENPLSGMIGLAAESELVSLMFGFAYAHFFFKGLYGLASGGKRNIPSSLFFLSLSLFIAGVLFSVHHRDTVTRRTAAGEEADGVFKVVSISMDLPEDHLVIGDGSQYRLTGVTATVERRGEHGTLKTFPFLKQASVYSYIEDAGISPRLTVVIRGVTHSFEKMQLLPPGRIRKFSEGDGSSIAVSLSPEKEFKKGRLSARRYDLRKPLYRVVVETDKQVLFDASLGDDSTRKENNIEVRTGSTVKWIDVVLVRDGALLFIYAGLFGVIAGVILYPLELYAALRRGMPS